MSPFERAGRESTPSLIDKIEDDLRKELREHGFSEEDSAAAVECLRELAFAGLIAFTAQGETAPGPTRDEIIERAAEVAARVPELKQPGLTADDVGSFLTHVFQPGGPDVHGIIADEQTRRAIVRALMAYVAEQTPSVSPQVAEEAAELINSGVLVEDLAGVSAVTARTLMRMPVAVVAFLRAPLSVVEIAGAIAGDVRELPGEAGGSVLDCLGDLLRGASPRIDRPQEFPLFGHTFRKLLSMAPVDVVRDWSVETLGHDSVRLATIVYAKMNGVEISDADIDAVVQSLRTDSLAPALVRALERYRTYYRQTHGLGEDPSVAELKGRLPFG